MYKRRCVDYREKRETGMEGGGQGRGREREGEGAGARDYIIM